MRVTDSDLVDSFKSLRLDQLVRVQSVAIDCRAEWIVEAWVGTVKMSVNEQNHTTGSRYNVTWPEGDGREKKRRRKKRKKKRKRDKTKKEKEEITESKGIHQIHSVASGHKSAAVS